MPTKFILVASLLLTDIIPGLGQSFKAMTFNIRLDNAGDAEDNWHLRKADMIRLIENYSPAFLGIQEGLPHQVTFIDSSLINYRYVGVGRDDGALQGEFSALFYDAGAFKCLQSKTFWLSETPDVPSFGWDAEFKRVCTYGLFKHRASGKKIYVFNTHFDHIGTEARINSAQLILAQIKLVNRRNTLPVVLMGDFNVSPDEEPIRIIASQMQDALHVAEIPTEEPTGTFNGFKKDASLDRRIDYIFISDLQVLNYHHLTDKTEDNRWISDHLPVIAEVRMK